MTKRTAALAAASKLSTSKGKSKIRKVGKKESSTTSKSTSSSKNTTNENNNRDTSQSHQPWFTVFTKSDQQYDEYMSKEWSVEKRGDQALFEKLTLEGGAQSGLSWLTILRKREAYRKTFYNFDIPKVAKMTSNDIQQIMDSSNKEDPTQLIVRHRGKIESTINNAQCILKMYDDQKQESDDDDKTNEEGGMLFDHFLWSFVNDKPILNTTWKQGDSLQNAKSKSLESEAMSKALKKRGFRFVGPTTCYSMMQSVGMVIDHPYESKEWKKAVEYLKKRPGGYQKDTDER